MHVFIENELSCLLLFITHWGKSTNMALCLLFDMEFFMHSSCSKVQLHLFSSYLRLTGIFFNLLLNEAFQHFNCKQKDSTIQHNMKQKL